MSDGATIDLQSVHVLVGPHRVSGRAKGSWLSVAYDSDETTVLDGIDDEGMFIDQVSRKATIVVTLLQSSDSNDVLSGLVIANRATPGGLAFPLNIIETNGRTLYTAAQAKVAKMADGTWSDGGEVRTWTIVTPRLIGFVGGLASTPTA